MKNIINRKNLLLAVTLLLAPAVQGQEFIKEVKNHYDNYSVIRQYRENCWIVSDYNLGKTVFSMVTETGTITHQLVFGYIPETDSTVVWDFKIYNDTIYFCGQTWYGSTSQAVWGYFPLAGFPSVPVYYSISKYMSLNKLEVFSADSIGFEVHVTMIGHSDLLTGHIVDELRIGPNTYREYSSIIFNDPHIMSDLIQTDKYIVVSAGKYFNGTPKLISISKPTTTNTTIFQCPIKYHTGDSMNAIPKLVACTQDAFAAVYRNSANTQMRIIGFTDPQTVYATTEFDDMIFGRNNIIADVEYDYHFRCLEVLIQNTYLKTSQIYRIDNALAAGAGNIPYLIYNNNLINSMVYLGIPENYFIASGHEAAIQKLRVYRFPDNPLANCAESGNLQGKKFPLVWKSTNIQVLYEETILQLTNLSAFYNETPITTICE